MWICQRCQTENQEYAAACASCGAARPARRFGPAVRVDNRVQPPRVSSPGSGQDYSSSIQPASPPARPAPGPAPQMRKRNRSKAAALARGVGLMLSVLLPVLTILLAWRQYDLLSGALTPLLLGKNAPAWAGIVCYIILALTAALLALLPGLWTLLLARQNREER